MANQESLKSTRLTAMMDKTASVNVAPSGNQQSALKNKSNTKAVKTRSAGSKQELKVAEKTQAKQPLAPKDITAAVTNTTTNTKSTSAKPDLENETKQKEKKPDNKKRRPRHGDAAAAHAHARASDTETELEEEQTSKDILPLNTKRITPAEDAAAKRHKLHHDNPTDDIENRPPPWYDEETRQESIDYQLEQERRARQNLLQTAEPFEEEEEEEWCDPMLVAEYEDEIWQNMRDSEAKILGNPRYADNEQHEVSWKMRAVLIDWIIEVHYIFELLPETLFLTCNIIDRFLSRRSVALSKIQLVGLAALYIAVKFEEVAAPRMKDFLKMASKTFQPEDMMKAERYILQVIEFQLVYPNPVNFLRRTTKNVPFDEPSRWLAKYFMEVSCIDHRFIGIKPSEIAAAAFWLAQRILAKGSWGEDVKQLSGYQASDIKKTAYLMLDYLSRPVEDEIFFKKWASKRLMKASLFVRGWIQKYYADGDFEFEEEQAHSS
ncbi:cyclin-like protein [Syncephalastrum racemosum]|uniref:Cyclin-like protein n=1 Tax=Syncephalastrum racemosum TaxID=13706 RepID=A0A1X2HM11_SYNRA|nr:cyclin-like protein [Syncephalastrum racemosum]